MVALLTYRFKSVQESHAEDISEDALLKLVDKYNNDPEIHGILVQLPLPKHINEEKVLMAISPMKDVDGFHPTNVGKLLIGNPNFLPCTPYGCQVPSPTAAATLDVGCIFAGEGALAAYALGLRAFTPAPASRVPHGHPPPLRRDGWEQMLVPIALPIC